MRNGNRKFYKGEVMHVYQRAIHGFNIFYTLEDFIVFYTILSVFSRRFKITILALCLMIDHFHTLVICDSRQQFHKFVGAVTSLYSRLFNKSVSRKGRLFDKSFGSAPKVNEKQIRTAIPYLFNNPVEKKICSDPIDYLWNFLAFIYSEYPHSEDMNKRKMSQMLKDAITVVDQAYRSEQWINYALQTRIFRKLSARESAHLTDYIIRTYLPFDIKQLTSFYKSPQMMLTAIRSNTGSEYNIREEYNPNSDILYDEIQEFIIRNVTPDIKNTIKLTLDEKIELANRISAGTSATNRQIAKFLHIPLEKKQSSKR